MTSTALNAPTTPLNFSELVASLPQFSLNSLVCRKAKTPMNDRPVLIVEDSPTSAQLARFMVEDVLPGVPIVVSHNLIDAARHLRTARIVIIDWRLEGITAGDGPMMQMLRRHSIPFFLWTAEDALDLPDVPVVEKHDGRTFKQLCRRMTREGSPP